VLNQRDGANFPVGVHRAERFEHPVHWPRWTQQLLRINPAHLLRAGADDQRFRVELVADAPRDAVMKEPGQRRAVGRSDLCLGHTDIKPNRLGQRGAHDDWISIYTISKHKPEFGINLRVAASPASGLAVSPLPHRLPDFTIPTP
jgi:hypothetical protein